MNEEKSTLSIVDDLSSIFPDIDGELCSRHSSLMGKLKSSFNNLYGGTFYLIQTWTHPTSSSSKELQTSSKLKRLHFRSLYKMALFFLSAKHTRILMYI